MGLLSNPKAREKLMQGISRYGNILCFLCYIAGLAWFLALAYRPLNAGTYFSENALSPGLVDTDIYHDYGAGDFFRDFKNRLREQKDERTRENIMRMPMEWLAGRFRELGLDVFVQNFTFQYPLGLVGTQKFPGSNVYGILRAPRAASTEAVVLSAPFRHPDQPEIDKTVGGVALMYGLAKAFRKHSYWGKDIIFLVTEHDQIGMQAWLQAYHHSQSSYIEAGELLGRGGSIQAAINLEIPGDSVSRFNLKLEGLNGQLPNLDLVNTAVKLCRKEGITPSLHKRINPTDYESLEGFQHSLKTMLAMMMHQAPGTPTGNHGLFHRYHIEALTLQGVKLKNARKNAEFLGMARIVEGLFRSLNNLLERFHQSFFFYLLPSTDRYVSIGLYMPPFGLLAAPVIIKALVLWIHMSHRIQKEKEEQEKKKTENKSDGEGDQAKQDESKAPPPVIAGNDDLLSALPVCILGVFLGLIAYAGPAYFVGIGQPLRLPPGESLIFGALAIQFTAIICPRIMARKGSQRGVDARVDGDLLKCVALLMLGVILSATSVINISLAFFLAVTWVPVMLIVGPSHSRLLTWLQYLILLLVSPLSLLTLGIVGYVCMFEQIGPIEALGARVWGLLQQAYLTGVVDAHILGLWTHAWVTLTLVPCWLLFWTLLWAKPSKPIQAQPSKPIQAQPSEPIQAQPSEPIQEQTS